MDELFDRGGRFYRMANCSKDLKSVALIQRPYNFVCVLLFIYLLIYVGVSLNGGTPKHSKMIIFSRTINGCWVPPF